MVIPTLNEEKVIGECLEALVQQQWSRREFEVIVADNGSVDGTLDAVRGFLGRLNLTVVVRSGCHVSALRNSGACEGKGKILAFLDADCLAPPTWLESAVSILGDADDMITGSLPALPENSTWVARAWDERQRERRGAVFYVPSCALFISRKGFRNLGGFDEDLETNEDVEICQRAAAAGFKVLGHPELSTVHLGTPQTLGAFWRTELWWGIGMRSVLLGHSSRRGLTKAILLTLYSLLSMAVTLLAIPIAVMTGKFTFLAIGPVLLASSAVFMAARTSIRLRRWEHFIPLTALYVIYGIARGLALLLRLRGKAHRIERTLGNNSLVGLR